MPNHNFYFTLYACKLHYYDNVMHLFDWKLDIKFNGGLILYLARDIPLFVMYFIYGISGSSLLIECTDSMIIHTHILQCFHCPSRFFSSRSAKHWERRGEERTGIEICFR